METTIGRTLATSRMRLATAGAIGTLIVAMDLIAARQGVWYGYSIHHIRVGLIILGLVCYGGLARWDRQTLGLIAGPGQGYTFWFKITLVIGLCLGLLFALLWAVLTILHVEFPAYVLDPRDFWPGFLRACIYGPLLEEGVYRFALCAPAARILKPTGAIALSGVAFAVLHVAYGNPGPDNCIAGFILAWAYLSAYPIILAAALSAPGGRMQGARSQATLERSLRPNDDADGPPGALNPKGRAALWPMPASLVVAMFLR